MQGVSPISRRKEGSEPLQSVEFPRDFNVASTPFPGLGLVFSIAPSLFDSYYQELLLLVAGPPQETLEEALAQGGFSFDPIERGSVDPLVRTKLKYDTLLGSSVSAEDVALLMDTGIEEIKRRLAERTLYGVPTKDGWKVPVFQFENGHLLPGIEEVLPLLHEELHPIAVQNWLYSPDPELSIGGEPVSPRRWLLSGRGVADVARIAVDL